MHDVADRRLRDAEAFREIALPDSTGCVGLADRDDIGVRELAGAVFLQAVAEYAPDGLFAQPESGGEGELRDATLRVGAAYRKSVGLGVGGKAPSPARTGVRERVATVAQSADPPALRGVEIAYIDRDLLENLDAGRPAEGAKPSADEPRSTASRTEVLTQALVHTAGRLPDVAGLACRGITECVDRADHGVIVSGEAA